MLRALVTRMVLLPRAYSLRCALCNKRSICCYNRYAGIGVDTWISSCRHARKAGGGSCRPSSTRKCCRVTAPVSRTSQQGEAAPFMAELQAKARAAGPVESRPARVAADEPGTRLSNLEYAPLAEIMGRLFWAPEVVQLPGARCAQHDRAAELRDAGAEEALARSAAQCEDALGLRHDRAGCRLIRCDQHRHEDRPRRRRLRHHRPEMVHHRRRASATAAS